MNHTRILGAVALTLALASAGALAEPKNGKPGQGGQPYSQPEHSRYEQGPSIDIRAVRHTLQLHRDLYQPAAPLPPGVRKNLARGKPLPPGIAMKLDQRLVDRLPHYSGYEWRQVGRDLLLIAAGGIIYEILENVLE